MTPTFAVSFFQEALTIAGMLSLPALGLGLVVGLMISIFQAVTQIQEQTLALIPKIVAIGVALMIFGSWMLGKMLAFTEKTFMSMSTLAG
jgi:flagellar biosynthetic protein FliQ